MWLLHRLFRRDTTLRTQAAEEAAAWRRDPRYLAAYVRANAEVRAVRRATAPPRRS